ncbi:MAG: hypothetical protein PSX71_12625 [bacterium]|nr:hypothetical protein [bacterium]
MPHQQSSSNVIMLILLRISLILVATLAALLTTAHYMNHDLPLGKTWLLLVTTSGCLFIGSELITLFRLLARRSKPGLVSGG